MSHQEQAGENRSPLTSIGNQGLNLKPWNEAMDPKSPASALRDRTPKKLPWNLSGSSQRTPVPKVATPSWATRRVATGSTPAKRPVQLSSRFFEAPHKDNLKAASLSALPNATQADFWLRKARNLQANGETKEARDTLREAQKRDVRPATDISKAIAQLEGGESLEASAQPKTTPAHTGVRLHEKPAIWPSLQGTRAVGPHSAVKPGKPSVGLRLGQQTRDDQRGTPACAPTPLVQPPVPPHVHFCTPEANVVAQAASPSGEGINSLSAGSTPFRISPEEVDKSLSDYGGGSPDDRSPVHGSDSPGTQMKQLVVPILVKTLDEIKAQSDVGCTPALKPSVARKSRFLAQHIAATPSGAVHLTPAGFKVGSAAQEDPLLKAVSPRSNCSDASGDSTLLDAQGTLVGLAFTEPVTPVAAQQQSGDIQGTETSAERTPELCLRENELFNATPSPAPAVREEYTPLSKLVDVPQAAGGSMTPLLSAMPQALVEQGEAAGCMSPEILGFTERSQAAPALGGTPIASLSRQTSAQPSPLGRLAVTVPAGAAEAASARAPSFPQTPKSAVRHRPPLEPSSLSKPQRMSASRPRVGRKELKALQVEGPRPEALGSVAALSPMKTPSRMRGALGADQVVVTPVRRSARKSVASQALPSSVLRQSGYAYVPNSHLEGRLGKAVVIGPPEAFRAFLEAEESVTMSMAALHVDAPVDEGDEGVEGGLEAIEGKTKDGKTQPMDTLAEAPESEGSKAQVTGVLPASRSRTTRSTAKQGKLSMSPTEQDIRETLRRSAKARA